MLSREAAWVGGAAADPVSNGSAALARAEDNVDLSEEEAKGR